MIENIIVVYIDSEGQCQTALCCSYKDTSQEEICPDKHTVPLPSLSTDTVDLVGKKSRACILASATALKEKAPQSALVNRAMVNETDWAEFER